MKYELVKKNLGSIIGTSVFLRKLFYRLLNILLLRAWYINKELKYFRKKCKDIDNITVLDAGSGFGQCSYYIAKNNPSWKIDSIDINTKEVNDNINFFKKDGITNASFKVADLAFFSKPLAYDLILSVDVMEHIEDDNKVFQNFFESLKENGMLLISTPSNLGGSDIQDHGDNSFIEEHVRDGYSKNDILLKLKNVGFKNIDLYYSYGKYGNISWRLSIKYPLLISKYKLILPFLFFYYILVMPICLVLNFIDTIIHNKKGTGLVVKAYK